MRMITSCVGARAQLTAGDGRGQAVSACAQGAAQRAVHGGGQGEGDGQRQAGSGDLVAVALEEGLGCEDGARHGA